LGPIECCHIPELSSQFYTIVGRRSHLRASDLRASDRRPMQLCVEFAVQGLSRSTEGVIRASRENPKGPIRPTFDPCFRHFAAPCFRIVAAPDGSWSRASDNSGRA
jgi:hypothetical protein